jgi:glucose-6-phosphate isomerase
VAQAPALSASLGAHKQAYEDALRQLDAADFERRLLAKDSTLWSGDQAAIGGRLGWLTVPQGMLSRVGELAAFAEDVRQTGFERVVLLGMGGSSLAPEVMSGTFDAAPGRPALVLLDTTDGATIADVERRLDPERTLFVVSSKSGTTTETASLHSYFAEKQARPLKNFIAITDPGTPLEARARAEGFRTVYLNRPDVGGRFSALSYFGLVPAAAIGIDVGRLLGTAMSLDVGSGIELGALLGGLAAAGRDKVTFVATSSLRGFVAWAEQLLAESTGKLGKGIIPVDGEPLGGPAVYGDDRVFVYLRLDGETGPDEQLGALEAAGHPVVTITLGDRYDLGAEFLRWEIATAAAGAILGINPFDEPNVAEAKERTAEILRQGTSAGDGGATQQDADTAIRGLLASARSGDYLAILAFIPRTAETDGLFTRLRVAARDQAKLATSVGYGPRYLHSTGQLFKGGPDTGLFIQVVADDAVDLPIPGALYSFGALKRAQALGDLQALQSRGRRVVRVDLGAGGTAALERIVSSVESQTSDAARAPGA